MKTDVVYQENKKEITQARVFQFPNRKSKKVVPSISCCKAQNLDWDFSRGGV